jgi:hypothetical protein
MSDVKVLRPGWHPIALGMGWKYGSNENIILPTSKWDQAGPGWRIWTDLNSESALGMDPFFADLDEAMKVVESLAHPAPLPPSPNDPDTEWVPSGGPVYYIGSRGYRV